ncbi:MAG TPA: caspase family protein, partial [Bacteroidales bacterium]|nr:caspase family protein [Bacteroidales bacterium]
IPVKTEKPNLYFIVVSVSDYHDPAINLKYAVKDGRDLTRMFLKNKSIIKNFGHIEIDTLFDSAATRENFFNLKSKILSTKPNDRVIVFFSGHGLLNEDQNFYYATSDIDFEKPDLKGIAFDEIETFLDSIPARHKLLLVDACHSGEVDKEAVSDDIQITDLATDSVDNQLAQNNMVKEYTYRSIEYNPSKSGAGIYNSFDIMKEMFAGLDKGTGTMVLAAAAGTGFAIESNEWKNGIFTFTIINGVQNKQADLNHDGHITVSEIKDYSIKEVETITGGRQKPTARKENSAYDWKLR